MNKKCVEKFQWIDLMNNNFIRHITFYISDVKFAVCIKCIIMTHNLLNILWYNMAYVICTYLM